MEEIKMKELSIEETEKNELPKENIEEMSNNKGDEEDE